MNSKFVTFFALCALFACTLGNAQVEASTIQLNVFEGSTKWWIAVAPTNGALDTVQVEVRESSSSTWTTMKPNPTWGYFQSPAVSGTGFDFPLSFRFTSSNGAQVTANSVLTSVSAGSTVDAQTQYAATEEEPTDAAAEEEPTEVMALRSHKKATQAPTKKPTQAPTKKPTQAPTSHPTSGAATSAPTAGPTSKPTTDLCGLVPTTSEPLKLLVPLYVYPGAAWDTVIAAAKAGAQIIAIINPNSGPSSPIDATYTTYIQKLLAAKIEVVGYVHTSWAGRALADVTHDIDTYASLYAGLTGIFLDEASALAGDVAYYQSVYNHIMAKSGYQHTILNPGTQPDQGYLAVSTNIVIYENSASSLASTAGTLASWVKCAPSASAKANYKYKFSAIAYGASVGSVSSYVNTMNNMGVGLVYVTDGAGGCCTYNTLTSYLPQETSAVVAIN